MPPNGGNIYKTRLVIIGGGIAGLSLAYEAAKRKIDSIVLDNGLAGTTHAATGILDARVDHIPRDIESVEQTAREIIEWRNNFPHRPYIIKPKRFLLPIGPATPHSAFAFDAILELYEKIAFQRMYQLPEKHMFIPVSLAERIEPNLRKKYFESVMSFWLWTVNPDALLRKVGNEAVIFPSFAKRLVIKKITGFTAKHSYIEEVSVEDYQGGQIKIKGHGSLVVVNTTGPWIGETLGNLGIKFPIDLKLGIQAKFSGYYFDSDTGILTFGEDGKYIICLQENGYLQVGPTNIVHNSPPNHLEISEKDSHYLKETLSGILDQNHPVPSPQLLKYGWRVKPKYMSETDRPIIWHHQKDGFNNLYTLVPGKMALGLLSARELLLRLASDGWADNLMRHSYGKVLSLDGYKYYHNQIKLLYMYLKSHFIFVVHFLKFWISQLSQK